jgi:SAM-dependent methyltransferase
MACPICRSNDAQSLYERVPDLEHGTGLNATFMCCRQCGVLFQDPPPDSRVLRARYPTTYRATTARGLYGHLKFLQAVMIARRLRAYIGSHDSCILELGCGAGQLLLALRHLGFSHLSGVDWNISPELTEEAPSISFIAHDVTSYAPPQPVDIVLLNNVIEHVRDPQELLVRYREYLRENGVILLLTPNAKSLCHRIYGRYWSGLHSPWHVHVFTRQSLVVMAAQAGYQIRYMGTNEDPGGWAISLQNFWRSFRPKRPRLIESGFGLATAVALVCCLPIAFLAMIGWRGSSLLTVLQPRATRPTR